MKIPKKGGEITHEILGSMLGTLLNSLHIIFT